jgi:hypothetical protein
MGCYSFCLGQCVRLCDLIEMFDVLEIGQSHTLMQSYKKKIEKKELKQAVSTRLLVL